MKRRKPLFITLCAVTGTLSFILMYALIIVSAVLGPEIGSGEYYDNPKNYEKKDCYISMLYSAPYEDNSLSFRLKFGDDKFTEYSFVLSGDNYRVAKKKGLLGVIDENTVMTVWIVEDYSGYGWYPELAGITYNGVEYLPLATGYKNIANDHYELSDSALVGIPVTAVLFVFVLLHFIANFIIYFVIAKPADPTKGGKDSKIKASVEDLIGNTPIVRLEKTESLNGSRAKLFAKLEMYNPSGSVKDRAALAMIDDAESHGLIGPGSVIVEPTSGNTGIGLAMIAARRGYKLILTMPETMSVERQKLLKAYGAEIVLTDGAKGMKGAIEKAQAIKAELGAFMPEQFVNPANPDAHFATTGPEIWRDMGGKIDILVAGVGTGGSISGIGRFLKSKKSDIRIVAVEPKNSPLLSSGKAGPHGIQGIGAGFVPPTLDTGVYDEVATVTELQAYTAARAIAKTEGILMGISSGAAMYCATELSMRPENAGKNIVVILPDSGDRYLSTPLFGQDAPSQQPKQEHIEQETTPEVKPEEQEVKPEPEKPAPAKPKRKKS